MIYKIPRRYIHTVTVYDLTNPVDQGLDQYVPNYELVGDLACWLGVSPQGGRLTMYVPEPIKAFNPYIANPRNQAGVAMGRADYLWSAGTPIPEVDAFGNVNGFNYVMIESKS